MILVIQPKLDRVQNNYNKSKYHKFIIPTDLTWLPIEF